MRSPVTGVLALAALLLGACGEGPVTTLPPPAAQGQGQGQYDGPLHVERGRYGAAGEIVDCRHGPREGRFEDADVHREGATSDSVEDALETARAEGLLDLPDVDLEVAGDEGDRVLLAHRTEGRIVVALVFREGPATAGAGGDGWYLESSARCDLSELAPEVAEGVFGTELWVGPDGLPALTTRIVSAPGPEHCGWQSMTFLSLGRRTYVRAPLPDLREHVAAPYVASMRLPDDAVDTGYSREGDRLWLSPAGDRAYVGRRGDVEAWPEADLGCA